MATEQVRIQPGLELFDATRLRQDQQGCLIRLFSEMKHLHPDDVILVLVQLQSQLRRAVTGSTCLRLLQEAWPAGNCEILRF